MKEKEICLQKDDVIVMFTDGIPETMDREKELWGRDKLKDVIRMNYNSGPEELSKIILNEANKFADGLPLDDDATIITFKIN